MHIRSVATTQGAKGKQSAQTNRWFESRWIGRNSQWKGLDSNFRKVDDSQTGTELADVEKKNFCCWNHNGRTDEIWKIRICHGGCVWGSVSFVVSVLRATINFQPQSLIPQQKAQAERDTESKNRKEISIFESSFWWEKGERERKERESIDWRREEWLAGSCLQFNYLFSKYFLPLKLMFTIKRRHFWFSCDKTCELQLLISNAISFVTQKPKTLNFVCAKFHFESNFFQLFFFFLLSFTS